ncbi:MAG: hypothetical protein C5B45_05225 [Chlamydiae bacterium]|nr:MAG: hypothetical protein C5B45_05225 [Chlamydiota bacterium]
MDAWKNGTTSQHGYRDTVISVYCTAATIYIMYLKAQENVDCDCLAEQFLEESWQEKNQERNVSLYDFALSVDQEKYV